MQDDPLMEMNVNSTPNLNMENTFHKNGENILRTTTCVTQTNISYNDIEAQISRINVINQNFNASIQKYYDICLKFHNYQIKKVLIKKHLSCIVKLINSNNFDRANVEILELYNTNNRQDQINNTRDILFVDFTVLNENYLQIIKILILQILLKTKKSFNEIESERIVKLFMDDKRYMICSKTVDDSASRSKPTLSGIKIYHTLMKVILNFYNVLSPYKLLFGLKFLEYLKAYDLKFENYITNISLAAFSNQLRCSVVNDNISKYLNSYYIQYSEYNNNIDKIMISDILHETQLQKNDLNIQNRAFIELKCVSNTQLSIIFKYFQSVLLNKSIEKTEINNVINQLDSIWRLIRLETFANNAKLIMKLFDLTIQFINLNVKNISSVNILETLLNSLTEYTIIARNFKRLSNIIAVTYNCYMSLSYEIFLIKAAKLEIRRYILENNINSCSSFLAKFSKFIMSTKDTKLRLELFQFLFNIDNLLENHTFTTILNFCKLTYIHCFSKMRLNDFLHFKNCSEVMLAVLYAYSSIRIPPNETWSNITNLLYYCISGILNAPSDAMSKFINIHTPKSHALYKAELLIKSAYVLNLELSKHSTANLGTLTRSFIDKWMIKRVQSVSKEKISAFEYDFVKLLLNYLTYNNFDPLTVELALLIKKHNYYANLHLQANYSLLHSFTNLRMLEEIKLLNIEISTISMDFKNNSIDKILNYLNVKLQLQSQLNEKNEFEELFGKLLPATRPELFDINNSYNIPAPSYIKVLLFNIKLYNTASILQMNHNNVKEAIIEGKRSLKLAVSLIRKSKILTENCRLELINLVSITYINLVNQYTKIGISRDSQFYITEFSHLLSQLGNPSVIYKSLNFLHEYYSLSEQPDLADTVLQKANAAFEYIDGRYDINSLTSFLYRNKETSRVLESLELFFTNKLLNGKYLTIYWNLKLQNVTIDSVDLYYPDLIILNSINQFRASFLKVQKLMDRDPFFKSIFDSVTSLPSCTFPKKEIPTSLNNGVSLKSSISSGICDSPRSSNMTPKGKSMKQNFDRAVAIDTLLKSIEFVDNLDLSALSVHDLADIHSFYSLGTMLISNIQLQNTLTKYEKKCFALADLSKTMPMQHEKDLAQIESNIYDSFSPMQITCNANIVENKINELIDYQKFIQSCSDVFNVISIDICPLTNHLLLSKIDSSSNKTIHVRLPLNRINSRELDTQCYTFQDASDELNSIIKASNRSTSLEVTSNVSTKEEKKQWWKSRYDLDKRMEGLITKIDNSWFSGFSSFFDPCPVNKQYFTEFQSKFYEILHDNLPTRKQYGNPKLFIKLEEWILELFIKLDTSNESFLNMLEDLIYFVLDILLFHGEENAYDELDINMIFVQLEEEIKKYQSHQAKGDFERSHTFLIISSVCHNFPFENLSFLEKRSVSRVPSFSNLITLIKNNNHKIFDKRYIDTNISMVLNPNGDLIQTEERFKTQFSDIEATVPNSRFLCNDKPNEETFLQMLRTSNLFVYVGHGSGEQFVRAREIMKLDMISPSFLLGCSSASIKYFGKLEPTSTIIAYLVGNCPMVIGNLWDVTDKDIDLFSRKLFSNIKFIEDVEFGERKGAQRISLALSDARKVCYLRYLNGAAPVLYGLPIHFNK
ncbi:hypothetical protein TPHA_0D04010 [Tetrapisispora phaffii CBS 4417]|uniref:separase n=1 Tax=Tetrapisispora phaffii (strain ATCC 24235 / CBS 4417 / NBRC 1672 / NRRL Y-8282 / UCD 70-5) TaxID=1071381 RepID=G8BT64_TETPH|nr:hypothetical protein TPHA_0D04010 [Tetrapisispora phaffii CBS 4417]CCE63035.1 hypothetical protein TPHA_0D04010 [Tetrapisispora phaffii CBS 4417]